jgi:hypothetical protein
LEHFLNTLADFDWKVDLSHVEPRILFFYGQIDFLSVALMLALRFDHGPLACEALLLHELLLHLVHHWIEVKSVLIQLLELNLRIAQFKFNHIARTLQNVDDKRVLLDHRLPVLWPTYLVDRRRSATSGRLGFKEHWH